jgi:hypothetical protein
MGTINALYNLGIYFFIITTALLKLYYEDCNLKKENIWENEFMKTFSMSFFKINTQVWSTFSYNWRHRTDVYTTIRTAALPFEYKSQWKTYTMFSHSIFQCSVFTLYRHNKNLETGHDWFIPNAILLKVIFSSSYLMNTAGRVAFIFF